ncbi:formyl peptide receptor 2-like [Hyperolius riggenbachi]|uniref:formyl peptide receptor 2-like n=1 Tax=Hyperolius riggenbachi TaxID=752182 RepID=UPI0035A3A0CA
MSLYKAYRFIQVLSLVCYTVTFVTGVLGNGLVIWIAGFKMKTINAIWFLNLAIADFICNLGLPLRISQWAIPTDYEKDLCMIAITVMFINMFASVYFLTVISVDRCVSVLFPFWSKIYRTHRLASIVAFLTWLLCLLSSVPHVVSNYTYKDTSECFPKYEKWLQDDEDGQGTDVIVIIRNLCMFSFPFIIIFISYGLIAYKVKTMKRSKHSSKPFQVIITIVVCFFICWFPYNTWPLISLNPKHLRVHMVITEICLCLAYFNSCINPIIYVFFSQDFKKGFLSSMPAKLESLFNERPDLTTEESDFKETNVELKSCG